MGEEQFYFHDKETGIHHEISKEDPLLQQQSGLGDKWQYTTFDLSGNYLSKEYISESFAKFLLTQLK